MVGAELIAHRRSATISMQRAPPRTTDTLDWKVIGELKTKREIVARIAETSGRV